MNNIYTYPTDSDVFCSRESCRKPIDTKRSNVSMSIKTDEGTMTIFFCNLICWKIHKEDKINELAKINQQRHASLTVPIVD